MIPPLRTKQMVGNTGPFMEIETVFLLPTYASVGKIRKSLSWMHKDETQYKIIFLKLSVLIFFHIGKIINTVFCQHLMHKFQRGPQLFWAYEMKTSLLVPFIKTRSTRSAGEMRSKCFFNIKIEAIPIVD